MAFLAKQISFYLKNLVQISEYFMILKDAK